jgi:hypothetical protein
MLQVLVSFGATWDANKSDELVSSGMAKDEAPALRICMLVWSQELADDLPFTPIPLEVIERGADSTQAYIDDLKKSREIVLRRKICLVGSSCAGKTSLVKSIISKRPQLEHVDDRTVVIDHWQRHLRAFNKMADAAASRWTTQVIGTTPPPSIDSYRRIFKNSTLATEVVLGYCYC